MKKTLAILLALALVFSSVTVAFAEETLPADAKTITTLGMLTGAGNGVTLDYLKTAPSRIQAALMVLRLKGLDDEALAFTGTDNFADADKQAWAKPIMAYLKAHPEVGFAGVGNNNFDPTKEIDAQSYYKVMLETLGYKANTTEVIGDFTWNGVFTFAASKGLSKVANVLSYTVNDLATATVETLKANVAGSTTKTLGYSLVESKILTVEKAVEAGIYTAPVVTLAVESVTATNNKEVVITFNKDVDKTTAETATNYTFTGGLTASAASLSGKTVTVTFATFAAQQANIDVTVQNVKDAAGVAIAKVTKSVKFFDATVPTVASVQVTGPTTIKVTFSEPITGTPITTTSNFTIDNNTYSIASVVASGEKAVIITLGTSLPAGNHSVTVNATGTMAGAEVKDYAGFFVPKVSTEFIYVVDNAAPTVELVSAKQNEVKIKFSKTIDVATRANLSVYHTYNNNPTYVGTSTWGSDNQTVTVSFATNTNYLPIGTATIYVNAGTSPSLVKDNWGNAFVSTTLSSAITADVTAPTVTEVKVVNATTIEVTYSEAVSGANVSTNYTLKDSANTAVAVTSAVLKTGTTATYTLTTAQMNGGAYTIAIKGIKDTSVSTNAMVDYSSAVAVTDLIKPTVTAAGVFSTDAKKIVVKFGEAMATTGANSILDKANYQVRLDGVNFVDLSTITGTTIVAGAGNKSAIITFTSAQALTNGDIVRVARVADVAGNLTADFTTDVNLTGDDVVAANIDATKIKATAKNTVTFEVDTTLSGIDVSKFALVVNGADKAATAATYVNGDNKATVTVVVDAANAFATDLTTTTPLQNVKFAIGGLTTSLGTSNSAPVSVAVNAATADYVAPAVVSTVTGDSPTVNGKIDKITVTYSEALYVASVADADYAVEGYEVTGVSVLGAVVTINVKELSSVDTASTPKVTLVGAVSDNSAQRNSIGSQAAVTSTDKVAAVVVAKLPVATTVVTANGTLTLTFSEAIDAASKTAIETAVNAGLTLAGNATKTLAWDSANSTLTVTIAGIAAVTDTVTVGTIANTAVTDTAANASAALALQ